MAEVPLISDEGHLRMHLDRLEGRCKILEEHRRFLLQTCCRAQEQDRMSLSHVPLGHFTQSLRGTFYACRRLVLCARMALNNTSVKAVEDRTEEEQRNRMWEHSSSHSNVVSCISSTGGFRGTTNRCVPPFVSPQEAGRMLQTGTELSWLGPAPALWPVENKVQPSQPAQLHLA